MFARALTSLKPRSLATTSKRFLNVHEYLGQSMMNKFDVATPRGEMAESSLAAKGIADKWVADGFAGDFVVKAQVLAGGRGRGHFDTGFQGGVHIASSPAEVEQLAREMIGHNLITKQTGEEGRPVNQVFITERMYLRREAYFAILLDRTHQAPVLVGSSEGGVNIEEVAERTPEKIFKEVINIDEGVSDEQLRTLAVGMGFTQESTQEEAMKIMRNLYTMFCKTDATQVEINPMAETPTGHVLCLDAKLNFDDNASFRQKDVTALHDSNQDDPREVEADKGGYEYIGLDGNIGCMVNGAGLAMATMDVIKLKGGEPANFLDLGGGASESVVTDAFKNLNHDPHVQAILVNIFGGIMRCDVIALGVIKAATEIGLKKPIVIRLEGTNVEEANRLIEDSGLRMLTSTDLDDAATKAVRVAHIVKMANEVDLSVKFSLPL